MKDRPAGVTERDLVHALADGWGLPVETLRYAPVGGGSYHWVVTSGPGEQWFVTVDDLDDKGWLGRTRPAVFAGLRVALDASVTLRREAGLRFVAAPVPALDGQSLRPLGDAHTVAVFPFLHGTPGEWDKPLLAADLDELLAMLAALHGVDPAAVRLRRREAGVSWRDDLELALRELGRPWTGGPFAEPARELLAGAAGPVRRGLDALDRWARAPAAPENLVITHGEPHPGNIIRVAADGAGGAGPASGAIMLIDWDTVGLAPPERDLWIASHRDRRRAAPLHRTHRPARRLSRDRALPGALGPGRPLLLRPRSARPAPPHPRHRTRLAGPANHHHPDHDPPHPRLTCALWRLAGRCGKLGRHVSPMCPRFESLQP